MSAADQAFLPAHELARQIRDRELSAVEAVRMYLDRIEAFNPALNAVVTLQSDAALARAEQADRALTRGVVWGRFHGVPVTIKDCFETAGLRTTCGFKQMADHVPAADATVVSRLSHAGAIILGKTNVPPLAADYQTDNPIFGRSNNPWNTECTPGGSSGGSAAAVAAGLSALDIGSDLGGSLRNPASFCNVVGFRPSPGRVPRWPATMAWNTLSVLGPMARTVQDVALMLAAMAGPDARDPISIREPSLLFLRNLERDFSGVKIAWSQDFNGLPVDERVTAVLEGRRHSFTDLGCIVQEQEPDFAEADEVFKVLRAYSFATNMAELLREKREFLKESVIWNIEQGLKLSAEQVGQAEMKRTAIYQRVRRFMETYEFMIFPVSQVPPFPVEQEYVTEINGVQMENYIDWMRSCYYISLLGLPAISVPCGFTKEGLPVGVQIVGRHRDDWGVLQLAYAFQQLIANSYQQTAVI